MAKSYADVIGETTDQTLDALSQAQEAWLQATEAAVGSMPAHPFSAFGPKGPRVTEAVEAGFDVAQKVLDQQRSYAVRLTAILTEGANKVAASADPKS